MIWALVEIVLPMFLTFLFGLLVGWIWWRRRGSTEVDLHGSRVSVGGGVRSDSVYLRGEDRAQDAADLKAHGATGISAESDTLSEVGFSGANSASSDDSDANSSNQAHSDHDRSDNAFSDNALSDNALSDNALSENALSNPDPSKPDLSKQALSDADHAEPALEEGRSMHEQALAKELTAANASIRSLVAELDVTRTRLESSESRLQALSAGVSESESDQSVSQANSINDITREQLLEQLQEQLQEQQQKYQELETSQSIDKAELAKNHHLESRINTLTKELSDNKSELATAKKTVSHLQNEVHSLEKQAQQFSDSETTKGGGAGSGASAGDESSDSQSSAELEQLKSRIAEMEAVAEQSREYQSQVAMLQARLQQSESKVRQIEQSGHRIEALDSQLQTRLADELEKAQQQIQVLEKKSSQATEKAADLVRVRSRVAALETELGVANSQAEEAARYKDRVAELETLLKGSEVKAINERLVEAEAQLRIANNRVADQQQQLSRLRTESAIVTPDDDTDSADKTSEQQLSESTEEVASQSSKVPQQEQPDEHELQQDPFLDQPRDQPRDQPEEPAKASEHSLVPDESEAGEAAAAEIAESALTGEADNEAGVMPESVGAVPLRANDGNSDPDQSDDVQSGPETGAVLAELPAELSANDSKSTPADETTGTQNKVSADAPAWQSGVTRFGTPAASHKDDLKVIRGIGPVLERTLNDADIQTWEQLSALSEDEVALIEQSIDFPGRMTREHWVEQATELVSLYPETEGRPSGKKLLPKKG